MTTHKFNIFTHIKLERGLNRPLNYTTMALDLIYLIIATPVTIAVMYGAHCVKQQVKHFNNLPEATPYEFERDQFLPNFNEAMKHQRKEIKRMYKGKIK